ncbi:hypothetical protein [Marinoscillum furvescens]|uniref:Dolichyl-phosphate-mannose-protein mannosyltransferase n=1 Tax=Marinoscillum furvescens DSM 4134 TaxID=1122208 RepID=A0A3D9LGJ3_MARFU|nr:hypothetical protein [Marinoscillum furvescens]REE05768.1 hypothetical protein C7460_101287 [Marinoscillum furvescens DSM 4134]
MIWQTTSMLILALVLIKVRPRDDFWKLVYWPAMGLRVAGALLMGWVYLHYLGEGDTITFHQEAFARYQQAITSPGAYFAELFTAQHPVFKAEARTELFTKILSVLYLLAGGSYWIAAAFLGVISFFCAFHLTRQLSNYFPHLRTIAIIAFLAWPSVIFWSSGILKDTLTNSALMLLGSVVITYCYRKSQPFSQLVLTFTCLLLLFYLKFYLAATAGLTLGLLAINTLLKELRISTVGRMALLAIHCIALLGMLSLLNFNLNIANFPQAIYTNYTQILDASPEHHVVFENLTPTYSGLLKASPESFFAGLFRPLLFEGSTWFLPFGLENLTLLLLTLLSIYWWRHIRMDAAGWCAIIFCSILAITLPLAAPAFGTLIRYKTAYLPFLVFVLLYTPFRRLFQKD